jgi:hypothetical protein
MAECAGDSKRTVPVGHKDASQMHTFIQDTEQKGHQPFLLKKTKSFIGRHKKPAERRRVNPTARGLFHLTLRGRMGRNFGPNAFRGL